MAVSQKQIADNLGLSVITVSRALRGHPDIAPETKSRVLKGAKELGYKKMPSDMETEIRRFGVLIYSNDPSEIGYGVKSQIFGEFQTECRRLKIETSVEIISPLETEVPLLVRNQTIQAAILMGRYTKDVLLRLRGIPLLEVSSFIEDEKIPRIVADNFGGMRQATDHLIGLGHRQISLLSVQDENTCIYREREKGYRDAMREHGLEEVVYYGKKTEDFMPHLHKGGAIACVQDSLAFSLYDALHAAGWSLPRECSIVSFDDIREFSVRYGLTTYAPDWKLMGRYAANLLASQSSTLWEHGVSITIPGQLIVRTSAVPSA